ncbi:hypothetical protein R1flu_002457 [Riccia fluitans]|uniref:Phosphatidylinositol transfer protein N-terminal domain-containing protein n=1 Tax=Riccia fluitans TaxID=41844 RepID=A0ABD1Y939_9MARC
MNHLWIKIDAVSTPIRGSSPNALKLDPKSLKKRQVEYIDIAMDQPERYVEEEDPTLFASKKTGRGPLREGWQNYCEPVMCAYKCVTVDVPYWGWGSSVEKFISKNAQRKILLEGHRKCFCWIDEWFGLSMEDIRRMEHETAEAIRRARAQVLSRMQCNDEEDWNPGVLDCEARPAGDSSDLLDVSSAAGHQEKDSSLGGGSAPPMPSLPEWSSSEKQKGPASADELTLPRQIGASCESFSDAHLNGNEWDVPYYSFEDQSSTEVSKCIDVLDRVIVWTKALRLRKSVKNSTGMVVPVNERSGEMRPVERNEGNVPRSSDGMDQYVGVLDSALSVVKWRPSKNKLM